MKKGVVCQEKGVGTITDLSQAGFTKMANCGFK